MDQPTREGMCRIAQPLPTRPACRRPVMLPRLAAAVSTSVQTHVSKLSTMVCGVATPVPTPTRGERPSVGGEEVGASRTGCHESNPERDPRWGGGHRRCVVPGRDRVCPRAATTGSETVRSEDPRGTEKAAAPQRRHLRSRRPSPVSSWSHYCETNDYGATVLRQAVNDGYEEGFGAGQADRQDRWASNYQGSYAYRDANSDSAASTSSVTNTATTSARASGVGMTMATMTVTSMACMRLENMPSLARCCR
jgi:hypothetical protein